MLIVVSYGDGLLMCDGSAALLMVQRTTAGTAVWWLVEFMTLSPYFAPACVWGWWPQLMWLPGGLSYFLSPSLSFWCLSSAHNITEVFCP